jgi:hypothetical protein
MGGYGHSHSTSWHAFIVSGRSLADMMEVPGISVSSQKHIKHEIACGNRRRMFLELSLKTT